MKKSLTPDEALFRAAAYCSTGEKCHSDIAEKLDKWGIARDKAVLIIEHLENEGYIDEQRYCRSFVNDKIKFDGWGRTKIVYTLKQKGLPTPYINEAITLIDDEEYKNRLEDLLNKKRKTLRDDDERNIRAKLMRFAASRGFELPYIYEILCRTDAPDEEYDYDD